MLSSVASSVKQRSLVIYSFLSVPMSLLNVHLIALWNIFLERFETNKDVDIKISVNLCKKKIKNSEWEILKSENLEIS